MANRNSYKLNWFRSQKQIADSTAKELFKMHLESSVSKMEHFIETIESKVEQRLLKQAIQREFRSLKKQLGVK